MWKEIKSGFLSATIIASIICSIGTVWAYADSDNVDINNSWEKLYFEGLLNFSFQRP